MDEEHLAILKEEGRISELIDVRDNVQNLEKAQGVEIPERNLVQQRKGSMEALRSGSEC
ncbi:hypothetical protein LCGC14_2237780 [marine sediment metagenome]|uniref:Uncharacterized protein n=1 Tax=marine sediment metagenome TaxID=412755 RepID=A0A0F9D6H6_9ZZZZ